MFTKKTIVVLGCVITSGVIAAVALNSAYRSDRQYEINRDSPTIASDVISTMSCYLSKLKVEDVLATSGTDNPPAYAAWMDVEACKSAGNVANDGSTVTPPAYDQLWVQPSRENGVIKVKLWGKTNTDTGLRNVHMAATIRGGTELAPPFGDWDIDWCVERLATSTLHQLGDTCYKKGHIRVSPTAYQLYYDYSGSGQPYTIRSSGVVSADMRSGQGRYVELRNNNDALTTQGHFAFASGALSDVTNDVASCKNPSRSATGVMSSVWEGWLYDKDSGEKIRMNGGFPVQNVDTKEAGWAGFDGVRLQGTGNAATSGTFKRVGAGADNTIYTAFGSFGKLIKITNESMTGLEKIDGLVLRPRLVESAFLPAVPDEFIPRDTRQKVLMYWSETESKFVITHRDAGTAANEKFVPLTTPVKKTVTEYLALLRSSQSNEYRIWAWQFGASNDFVIHLADLTNKYLAVASSDVKIYKLNQSQVTPGNGPRENLYCVGRCLDEVTVGGVAVPTVKGDYDRLKTDVLNKPYTYDNVSGNFKKGTLDVDFTKVEKDWVSMSYDPSSPPSNAWMGMFVEQSKLNSMTCTVSSLNDSFCQYNRGLPTGGARNANGGNGEEHIDTYYVWDTGTNRWNKFAGIKNPQGEAVPFDEPMILTYRASDSASFGSYRNKVATIKYPGEGRLWLPGSCKNVGDTNVSTSPACNNPDSSRATHKGLERWIHEFNIPYAEDTSGMVNGANGTEYLVKWTRKGTYYPPINASQCTGLQSQLQTASQRVMPVASAWVNPMNPASTNYLGTFDANYRSDDPLYVHGVLRTQ